MKPERMIDTHQHACGHDPKQCVKAISPIAEKLNIQKILLLGFEQDSPSELGGNDVVLSCWKEAKELIIPFAGINGSWTPSEERVEQLRDKGFKGLKFILPRTTYHDKFLYPWYEAAQEFKMPIVFHTGIIGRWTNEPIDVDNTLMRPIYLDSISRAFPNLMVIGAHLGNPWWDEAAMSCRWNPNLFFDLSGGTIIKKSPQFIDELLWWGRGENMEYADSMGRGAFEKILFGSDVLEKDVPKVVERYLKLFDEIGLSKKDTKAVFYDNAASILRKVGIEC